MNTRKKVVHVLVAGAAAMALGCGGSSEDSQAEQRQFWADPRNQAEHELFVLASAHFFLLHEVGHAVFDDYGVPLTGSGEDAADRFAAAFLGAQTRKTADAARGTIGGSASLLAKVAWFWINRGRGGPQSRAEILWFDEHGIDEQRGYDVLCLAYGSSPEQLTPVADALSLPEDRRAKCVPEAARNLASWEVLLSHAVADETEQRQNSNRPSLLSTPTGVFYGEHNNPLESQMNNLPWTYFNGEAFLRANKVLETAWSVVERFKKLPDRGLPSVTAQGCGGVANAFWDPRKREIILCYPLVEEISWAGRKLLWSEELDRRAAATPAP